jgi:hypothetical protein
LDFGDNSHGGDAMRDWMIKLAGGIALVASVSLVIAIVALREVREVRQSSKAEVSPSSIGIEGLMSRAEVIAVLGTPDRVFRRNPRAECWAYDGPYEIRMCFGPKRRLAWFSHNIPSDIDLLNRMRTEGN